MKLASIVLGTIIISAGVAVTMMVNPIHGMLSLIIVSGGIAIIGMMLGAEYVGATIIVVYIGAIAVLFIFVVMMLNIERRERKENKRVYYGIGSIVSIGAIGGMIKMIKEKGKEIEKGGSYEEVIKGIEESTNGKEISYSLYVENGMLLIVISLILLVAMMGAIVLTHRKREKRSQEISEQIKREYKKSITLVA